MHPSPKNTQKFPENDEINLQSYLLVVDVKNWNFHFLNHIFFYFKNTNSNKLIIQVTDNFQRCSTQRQGPLKSFSVQTFKLMLFTNTKLPKIGDIPDDNYVLHGCRKRGQKLPSITTFKILSVKQKSWHVVKFIVWKEKKNWNFFGQCIF